MKIVEDISYSIDDIIEAINDELGMSYIKISDDKGYINLGKGIKLNITFDDLSLESSKIEFPSNTVDITDDNTMSELYSAAIETSCQIVDIIRRMTGGSYDEDFD